MRPDPASNPDSLHPLVSRSRTRLSRFLCVALLALFGLVAHSATASAIGIHVKFGRPSQNCTGFGLCRVWIVVAGQSGHATDAQLRGDKLLLSFQDKLPQQQEVLPVEVPLEVDAEMAKSLGARGLVILPGYYPIDYSSNPNGEVALNVQRIGIVIDVEVGRRSKDCHGFGICSITVGVENVSLSDRTVRSVGTIEGDMLHLEFGERLPEQGDSLTIDENIVLDQATTRKNGLKWCEVLSGTYRVDYSNNPNGSVDIPVSKIGIRIDVTVGRRTGDGDCRPGFGICSIVISRNRVADHTAEGIATIDGDRLSIDFLSQHPDRSASLVVDENIELDPETARGLGAERVIIAAGVYPVDYSSNPNGTVSVDMIRFGITINIKLGIKSRGCNLAGICDITIGLDFAGSSDRVVPATANLVGRKLHLQFQRELPEDSDMLTISDTIDVDAKIAGSLGRRYMRVLPGVYRVVRTPGAPPSVEVDTHGDPVHGVDVKPFAMRLWYKIGRRSQDCWNFGLCAVKPAPDSDNLDRMVAGLGSLNGSTFTLTFQGQTPDRGEVLTIDEPIVFDEETAALYGCRELVILPGSYRVDYSKNPYGTVELDVNRIVIVITVEVGRRSKGCTGFGICSISVGAELNASDARVRPSMVGPHTLRLQFVDGLPQGESVMPVDEAITLGDDVAKAMGEGEMTILPGEYKVVRSADGSVHVDLSVVRHSVGLQVKIGRKSQDCWNFGICAIRLGHEVTDNARIISATSSLHGSTLTIAFGSQAPDQGDVLTIDEPITLDQDAAAALGSRELTILPGRYHVDYSSNPFGTVQLRTQRIGITIGVDVGRRSKDCLGLGICSITIDISLRARTVPSIGSIEDGKLHLVFGRELPESGDEFVVEEDIELGHDAARGLGHNSVTLKRGVYRINTDENGEQSVDIDVATRGITITIHIGRRGCDRGFGICRITAERRFDENTVMAVAEMIDGKLRLDFLGETLDRDETMVFEEKLELSEEVLIALGLQGGLSYSISEGAYPVDSSDNEYGTMMLQTATQGGSASVTGESGSISMKSSASPNPTSGATTIRFTLPAASAVSVTVANAQGMQVARPVENRMMGAGEQSISFNTSSLPAGVYYYSIETGSTRSGGTVVVVR